MSNRIVARLACVGLLVVALSGCGLDIPRDPDGTLDAVRGDVLRVGVSPNPPFTEVGDSTPTGTEVELARAFAERLDAEIEFTVSGEESLVEEMERGKLDLIIGGLTDKSPWFDKVSLTGPYTTVDEPEGTEKNLVMAVPLGENAFLVELEDFLQNQGASND